MKRTAQSLFAGFVALALFLVMSVAAFAAVTPTPFGDASVVTGGNPGNAYQIRSDASIAPGYGGVTVTPSTALAWSDLTTLSADYNVTDDDCGGGSPRFTLGVDTTGDTVADGVVHIAMGPFPSYTDCVTGWQSTGNVIGNEDAGRYDFSQFGGSGFTTYSNAPASVMAGTVVFVDVVADASWSADATGGDSEQTVLIDNITINTDTVSLEVTPSPTSMKDACKNNGWRTLTSAGGQPFRNQGQCVSYFNQITVSPTP